MLEVLKKIGLTEKEALVYLKLLKFGKSGASDLAKSLSIDRRTIYDVLDKLFLNGYVSQHKVNGISIYSPVDPKMLLEDLKEKEEELRLAIPNLLALSKPSTFEVDVFKGRRGMKLIMQDICNNSDEHYSFGTLSETRDLGEDIIINFLDDLNTKNHKERVLYEKGSKITKIENGEYKELSKDIIPPITAVIYNYTVALFIFDDDMSVIRIKSKKVFEAYKKYFNSFWNL